MGMNHNPMTGDLYNMSEATEPTQQRIERIKAEINTYLTLGGLFNPEMMNPDRVRDLIIDCRGIIAALTAFAEEEEKWQPISSAPKDATAVLLSGWCLDDPKYGRWVGTGVFKYGRWQNDDVDDSVLYPPTHWMPLPKPPL